MNRGKSLIWFSPNTPMYLRSTIRHNFGAQLTTKLGTYLGVPIIHGRVCKSTYQFVVDRVRKRLATWKMKSLSRATRLLLIQSTLLAIPIYIMQTVTLLVAIIKEVEWVCRQFFWEEVEGEQKMHTVGWTKICSPKQEGGLGLPRLWEVNKVLLAKLGWRLIAEPDILSSSVLRHKYDGWNSLNEDQKKCTASSTWRGISMNAEILRKSVRWKVKNGQQARFWTDPSLLDYPLKSVATQPIPVQQLNLTIDKFWTVGNGWKVQQI